MREVVASVIVTYNRKQLLVDCLNLILVQTKPLDLIYIIDNASTDGTKDFLECRGLLDNPAIRYIRLPENVGGAGGFHQGLKAAYNAGADWFWLMDDDTMPSRNALRYLLEPIQNVIESVGFVCSNAQWIDNNPHRMNLPRIKTLINNLPFNQYEEAGLMSIASCSFVSVLVSRKAVKLAGLPLKEMFIWGDDVEFFTRISSMGLHGFYSRLSKVIHKTRFNRNDDIYIASPGDFWKHKYGIRNELFNIRLQNGFAAFLKMVLWRLTVLNMKILSRRAEKAAEAVYVNTMSTFSALLFNPTIEKIS